MKRGQKHCSFCQKPHDEAERLFEGIRAFICEDCAHTALAAFELHHEEQGIAVLTTLEARIAALESISGTGVKK